MNKDRNDQAAGSKAARRLLSLTAILTMGLVGMGASPADASTGAAAPVVAFKAAVAGTVTQTSANTFTLAGAGVASPMGRVKYAGNLTITSPAGAVPLTDVLIETLTASNGDTLTLRCQQTATPIGSNGVLHGTDQWTVVSGTGSFAHATGSGTGNTYVYNLQLFAKTSSGTIR